ncbi:SET domain-containing protein-lysine N-methyltransferase [Ruegeria atlantica]|uniref:SET domain-containing protein-lysine N-methyltransferase n=1 Tax=Ruegeria atlantica TaxID=81569 RepID=UPI00147C6BC9|nr:SET domain-containing protein-lysine N-methyltransferase [Ruegeria atlantica]
MTVELAGPRIQNLDKVLEGISDIHGTGLFARSDIQTGAVLGYLDGQIVDYDRHPTVRDLEWNGIGGSKVLCRPFATQYALINHSFTPNLSILRTGWAIVACKDIRDGEELTLDYLEHGVPETYLNSPHGNYLRNN